MKKSFLECGVPKGEQECCSSSSVTMLSYFCMSWILLVLSADPALSESLVTGTVGQDITVPCFYHVRSKGDITSMCWGRGECPASKCSQTIIQTDGWKVTEQVSSRYRLKGDLLQGNVSLTIVNVKLTDSGTYCCRVEISGWFNDQKNTHKVVINKARISTARPRIYTSEQTSAPGSTTESSSTITGAWLSDSASEAAQTASGPCSSTSDCLNVTSNLQNTSLSLPNQEYSEIRLYIGIGLCLALLSILTLTLFLTRKYLYNKNKTGGFSNFIAYWRPESERSHSVLEDEVHAEENIYVIH